MHAADAAAIDVQQACSDHLGCNSTHLVPPLEANNNANRSDCTWLKQHPGPLCTQAFADNEEAQALAAGTSPSDPNPNPTNNTIPENGALRTATASLAVAAVCCAAALLVMA